MKFFFLSGRFASMIFVFTLVLPTLIYSGETSVNQNNSYNFEFLESYVENWHLSNANINKNLKKLLKSSQENFKFSPERAPKFNYDLTLVGFVNFADGIGRHPILFKECLENRAQINFLSTRDAIPAQVEDTQLNLPRLNPRKKDDIGAIALLTDILSDQSYDIYKSMPDSFIKIAYTMFESTEIPHNWISILNNNFDMAVVPDPFLVHVYQQAGVKIPLFVLPLPLILEPFFDLKQKQKTKDPFVFGMTGGFWNRKNHLKVLEAFAEEFGNNPKVKLRLHGRFGEEDIVQELATKIKEYNLINVELIVKTYDWDEYLRFFNSLDCYVFLSKGEGFSITPREALASGKPCILTNNTSQITLCTSGFVKVVPSNILVPAFFDNHYANDSFLNKQEKDKNVFRVNDNNESNFLLRSGNVGYQFDCNIKDARVAMRKVYNEYKQHLTKARKGKEWVKQYLKENLSDKYVSLIKPEIIILDKENMIGDNFLVTNSIKLYKKYKYLLGGK